MSGQRIPIESHTDGKAVIIEPKLMTGGQNYDYQLDGVPFRVILRPDGKLDFFGFMDPSLWAKFRARLSKFGRPS